MRVLEYGREHEKTLLFLPCTAEPEWAFTDSVTLLAQNYHVMQIVYDGHGETGEDFDSVEATVDEVTDWLRSQGVAYLDAAYGCSLGGACLTRLLALGKIPVGHAIIDAGITPYQMPLFARRLVCLCDYLGFKLVTRNRKALEIFYPPERWTLPGRDSVKEYEALAVYLKTYSNRTIRNIFWSANNYALPPEPAKMEKRMEQMGDYGKAFMQMLGGARPYVTEQSCKNQFYSDLITPLPEKIDVPGTEIHIFYALKMGPKYRTRYEQHFAGPVIHEQDLRHEELLACYQEQWAQLVKSIIQF